MSIRSLPAGFERAAALALLALASCHDSNLEATAATSTDPRWRPLIGEVCQSECEWSILHDVFRPRPVLADPATPVELAPWLAASQRFHAVDREYGPRRGRLDSGSPERSALRSRVRVHFDPITLHEHYERGEIAPHRALVISGRIGLLNVAGDAEEPITFRVPIRVAIAREPSQAIDWSAGSARDDTCTRIVFSTATGSFHAHIEPWEIARQPGATRSFQVGVGVLDLEPAEDIRWGPIPARDTALLSIPGPEPVRETESLIGGVAGPNPDTFEPVALVRAVNHLRALGKERAIVELDRYLLSATEYRALPWRRPDPANSDTFDANAVYLIVNRLFTPNESSISNPGVLVSTFAAESSSGTRHGDEAAVERTLTRAESIARARPEMGSVGIITPISDDPATMLEEYPFVPVGDLPFFAPCFGSTSGVFLDHGPAGHIRWARENGVWTSSRPLRPTDDPIGAAEEAAKRGWHPSDADPRWQLQRSLQHVVETDGHGRAWFDVRRICWRYQSGTPPPEPLDEAAWRAFAERARAAGIRWDERTQQYVGR